MLLLFLQAQVTSSNALKNSPFVLVGTGQPGTQLKYTPNHVYSKLYGGGGDDADGVGGGKDETSPASGKNAPSSSLVNVVKIPKSILTFVKIGTYTITEDIDHMPLVSYYLSNDPFSQCLVLLLTPILSVRFSYLT